MTDLIQKALQKIVIKQIKPETKPEESEDLLSRNEILKKIKTLSESVKECQKQRLKTFFPASALKTMLSPALQSTLKKDHHRSSKLINQIELDKHSNQSSNHSIAEEASSFTSSSDSNSSLLDWVLIFPQISLNFPVVASEYIEAKQKLEVLEKEFYDKLRLRQDKRQTQSIVPGKSSIFSLISCRSYVKFAKHAYEGEDLQFIRAFVSISTEELAIRPNARTFQYDLKLPLTKVQEIIDLAEKSLIYFIHTTSQQDEAMAISPLTSEDYSRWSNTCKNLSRLNKIIYKTQGEIPKKPEEEPPLLRHRQTFFTKGNSEMPNGIEEADEGSLITDSYSSNQIEEESEKSWDFNFDELDNEKQRGGYESDEKSSNSDEHNQNDEEKIRSLTVLAKLGKIEGLVNLLTKGGLFLKYGRWGKPHTRHILLTGDLKYVEWWHLNENKASGHMIAVNIISVQKGRKTKNFSRFKKPQAESLSFSLMCKKRSIDLELAKDNKIPVDVWILAFESLIQQLLRKDHVIRSIAKHSSIKE